METIEEAGSVTKRYGYSVFDEVKPQLILNLKDSKEEYRQHTVVHEFGHILGLKHEHQRSDFWRGIYRLTDFNVMKANGEQFSEREEKLGVYDNYTTYDPHSVMHYFWKLKYFKEQFWPWFQTTAATTVDCRKAVIAKKRLSLEISTIEEMVLMNMCDQLHKVKTLKYFIEYYDRKKKQERKWVPENQLEVIENPLPSKPGEDISKKAIYTYKASGKSIPFETHILKVEYAEDGWIDDGSRHINDAYKFPVKPSTKDIKLINWAYNTCENKPPRPYSLPKPPPPAIQPIQPTNKIQANHFKVCLEPFDRSYGDLGDFKVIVISGNPVIYNLAPTETHISDKALPKCKGQSKIKERGISVVYTGDASKLLGTEEVVVNEVFNSSIQIDEDDYYCIFIRLYTPNGKEFRDSATVPILELKSTEKVMICFESLIKRAKSEIGMTKTAVKANEILKEERERNDLKEDILNNIFKLIINLPDEYIYQYERGKLTKGLVENLISVMEFLLLFYGRNDLPLQLIDKTSFLSTDLKNDIAIYKAACEVEKFAVEDVDSNTTCYWRICSDDGKSTPAGYSKLRVSIRTQKYQYLFGNLMKLGEILFVDKEFELCICEMYTNECEASNLHIVFLIPLKDPEKALKSTSDGISEVVLISDNRQEKRIYPQSRIESDSAKKPKKRARKKPIGPETEGMLSLLSSMVKHSIRKTRVARVQADSGDESPMDLVLKQVPNWKVVAKDLKFSDERVKRIESDYLQPERCLYATIWKWVHNNKWEKNDEIPKPTVDNLKRVMENISTV